MSYSAFEIIIQVAGLLVGGAFGGGVVTFFTMRAQRKKANAEAQGAEASADSIELDNTEKAIKIWRELAEASAEKYNQVIEQVHQLKMTVDRLNRTNSKILRLLEKISPDNIEGPVSEIKKEIDNARA